jgi:hypothetical protein
MIVCFSCKSGLGMGGGGGGGEGVPFQGEAMRSQWHCAIMRRTRSNGNVLLSHVFTHTNKQHKGLFLCDLCLQFVFFFFFVPVILRFFCSSLDIALRLNVFVP